MTLIHPPNLEPVLIRFPLVIMALIKLSTIHLRLLVGNGMIHRTFIKAALRIHKSLLPLVFIFIYADINPSSILTLILLM